MKICTALERLGTDALLAIVGSWRDTLNDAEVLALLQARGLTFPPGLLAVADEVIE